MTPVSRHARARAAFQRPWSKAVSAAKITSVGRNMSVAYLTATPSAAPAAATRIRRVPLAAFEQRLLRTIAQAASASRNTAAAS